MSFEEEFDRIIRQKSEDANYPFEEKHWENASRLIDASRRAERIAKLKRFLIPGVAIVALGTAGVLTVNYFNSGSSQPVTVAENNISKKEVVQQIVSSNTRETAEVSPQNKVPAETSEVKNTPALLAVEKMKNTPQPLEQVNQPVAPATEKPELLKVPAQIPVVESSAIAMEKPIVPTINNENKNTSVGNESETVPANILQSTPVVIESGNHNFEQALPPSEKTLAEPANQNMIEPANQALVATEEISIEQLSAVASYIPVELKDDELNPPFTLLGIYDEDYYTGKKKPKTHYFNLEAGPAYLLGWDTKNGKDGKGFNAFAGFNYGIYLCRKMNISVGLQVYNISNISQPFYSSYKKDYDFGSTSSSTVISSNHLLYAALPLKFYYALNTSNQVGLGINAGYLMSASNSVETYRILDGAKYEPVTEKKWDVYEKVSSWNFMLSASYRLKLCSHMTINAEAIYGLTDIFENNNTVGNAEKPLGLRLGIQFTLCDK